MSSPYATAVRLQNRRVDEVRTAIREATELLDQAIASERALADAVKQEHSVQLPIWTLPNDAWAARMRQERARLTAEREASDARLNQLRDHAAETYGQLRAIEGAETRWRDAQEAAEAAAEQAEADDLAAARFMLALRQRKRHT